MPAALSPAHGQPWAAGSQAAPTPGADLGHRASLPQAQPLSAQPRSSEGMCAVISEAGGVLAVILRLGESDLLVVETHRSFQYWSILKLGLCIFNPWFFVSFSRSKSCFVCAQ